MARVKRNSTIEYRSNRAKLPARREPYWVVLSPGRSLGYRKGKSGTWVAKLYDRSLDPPRRYERLGAADDHADANGKDIFSYAQAQDMAGKWFDRAMEQETGEPRQKGPFTVRNAWEAYEHAAESRGMKGLDRTRCAARNHILPPLGALEVAKLTKRRIENWRNTLAQSPALVRGKMGGKAQKRPKAATDDEIRARKDTANRVLTILKALLNHAKQERLTTATGDAWRDAKAFRETTAARVRFLSPEEAQRLVNACPEDLRRLVKAALFTGGRYGELARLRVQDFDPKGGQGAGTVFIEKSKSGKSRHVILNQEGREFFQVLTAGRHGGELMLTRARAERTKRDGGDAWLHADGQRDFNRACEIAKIGKLRFHELRHTYASGLVNAGIPLAYVAAQLGHSSTRMVEKHYGHLAPSAMAEAITKLAPTLGIHTPQSVENLQIRKA